MKTYGGLPSEKEIDDFKKSRKELYLKTLEYVKEVLYLFYNSSKGRRAIYRIETRGNNQLGEELKTTRSLLSKLTTGYKSRYKKLKIGHWGDLINDMIALRVICIFPPDKKIIGDFIRNRDGKEISIVDDPEKEKPKEKQAKLKRGYRIDNFVVRPTDPQLKDFVCEIQICSLLELAWDRKTHDPIYKGKNIKREHLIQSRLLSDALSTIDQMSELLNEEIQKERQEEKRIACKMNFMKALTEKLPANEKQKERINEIKRIIHEKENELTSNDVNAINKVLEYINNYKKDFHIKSDKYSCRLLALLALIVGTDDLERLALKEVDDLVSISKETIEKSRAYILKGLVLYCFNKLDEAIQAEQEALKLAKDEDILTAKGDIAYFIADLDNENQEDLARQYATQICKARPDRDDFIDVKGYVLISFGKNFKEIYQGFNLCRRYFERHKSEEMAQAYFKLHSHKYAKQLSGLF